MLSSYDPINVLLFRTDVWALGCCLYSLAFLRNCFEEGSNLAILSRKYTIPEDNPYGEGLVELIDRMLTVDYKARADMTEVILCLSAVYSGRPLPPRKKTARTSKSDEKEHNKKMTSAGKKENPSIGKFRTDSQGFRDENIYDPSKVTEGKKLASNSVAARRKRAAVSSAAVTTPGPTPSQPAAPSSSTDPLLFSSIHGSEDETAPDVAFSSFGDLNGKFCFAIFKLLISIHIAFSTNLLLLFLFMYKGFDSSKEDFFKGFDKKKDNQQLFSNDGFDPDAFGATGWGETPTTSEQENTANLQKLSLSSFESDANNTTTSKNDRTGHRPRPRAKSSDSLDSFESFDDADNNDGTGAPHSTKPRRKSSHFDGNNNNVPHRSKQRRKSTGGKSRLESENAGGDGGEKKERRLKKDGAKNEDESRRRRSLSRSRRKPRRGSTTKPITDDKGSPGGEGKMSKATSIRNMFHRKQQANEDA